MAELEKRPMPISELIEQLEAARERRKLRPIPALIKDIKATIARREAAGAAPGHMNWAASFAPPTPPQPEAPPAPPLEGGAIGFSLPVFQEPPPALPGLVPPAAAPRAAPRASPRASPRAAAAAAIPVLSELLQTGRSYGERGIPQTQYSLPLEYAKQVAPDAVQSYADSLRQAGLTNAPYYAKILSQLKAERENELTGRAVRNLEAQRLEDAYQQTRRRNAIDILGSLLNYKASSEATGATERAAERTAARLGDTEDAMEMKRLAMLMDPHVFGKLPKPVQQGLLQFLSGTVAPVQGKAEGGLIQGMAEGGQVSVDPVAAGGYANLETGDYIIPADVRRFFGTKFFQTLIEKAEAAME
jgi:hypothetical protein